MLSDKNAHPRDDVIEFDEKSHTYTIEGQSNYLSMTTWLHSFFKKFDGPVVIQKMRKGRNWNPQNKYYYMTDAQILASWKAKGQESAARGTWMHENIEYFYNGIEMDDEFLESKEWQFFSQYFRDHQYIPYRTEWRIFSEEHRIAGSIDMVYEDPENIGQYMICDWKRVEEIKTDNPYEKGLGILQNFDNCNYWHYTLQLNGYRHILENRYQLKISRLFLVVLHPNQETYLKYDIPMLDMQTLFDFRLVSLK